MSTVLVNNIAPTVNGGVVDITGFRFLELALGGSVFKGNWASQTAYNLKDVVIYSNAIYRCTTAHTTGSSYDPSKWAALYLETNATVASDYTAIALALS